VGPGCKGGQTSHHLGAVRNGLLAVESTLGARETLAKSIYVRDAKTCRALGRAAWRTWQITRVSLLTVGFGRALMKRLLAGCLTAARLRFWKARILHHKKTTTHTHPTDGRIVSRNRGAGGGAEHVSAANLPDTRNAMDAQAPAAACAPRCAAPWSRRPRANVAGPNAVKKRAEQAHMAPRTLIVEHKRQRH